MTTPNQAPAQALRYADLRIGHLIEGLNGELIGTVTGLVNFSAITDVTDLVTGKSTMIQPTELHRYRIRESA